MLTSHVIEARCFPVKVKDGTGREIEDSIVLDKESLRAAQLCGQSSKEIIQRTYSRQGFEVLSIGKPEHRTISLNLEEIWKLHVRSMGS